MNCQGKVFKSEEQYVIPMLKEDYILLKSMRTDKKGSCEGKVDTKYHIAEAGKRKQRKSMKNYKRVIFQYEHRTHAVK